MVRTQEQVKQLGSRNAKAGHGRAGDKACVNDPYQRRKARTAPGQSQRAIASVAFPLREAESRLPLPGHR